jgi:hypothetical protein
LFFQGRLSGNGLYLPGLTLRPVKGVKGLLAGQDIDIIRQERKKKAIPPEGIIDIAAGGH